MENKSTINPAEKFHVKKIGPIRLFLELSFVVVIIVKVCLKRIFSVIFPALRRPKLDFHNKVVLLTGAAGGFGRKIAERLAVRGAILACVDIDKDANDRCVAAANEAAAKAGVAGSNHIAHPFRANLAKIQETKQLVTDVEQLLGRVDILISGAVCYTTYDVLGYADDEIDFLIDLNLKSTIWLTRAVLPGMKRRGFGQIAFLNSVAGLAAAANHSLYATCKSGLKDRIGVTTYTVPDDQAHICQPVSGKPQCTDAVKECTKHRQALLPVSPSDLFCIVLIPSNQCILSTPCVGFMDSLHEELRKDPSTSNIGVTSVYPYFSSASPIVQEMTTSRIPKLDADKAVDQIVAAIEYRDVHCVIPWYMALLPGVYGLLPQEAVNYIRDVSGARVMPKLLPKATVPVDQWTPIYTPRGAVIVVHDGDEQRHPVAIS